MTDGFGRQDEPLEQLLRRATREWLGQAAPLLAKSGRGLPSIEVCFDLRGKSAGQVRFLPGRSVQIRYNRDIARLQPKAFAAETVPHEVAHVITWVLHGDKPRPHGPEWRAVMAFFGLDTASRCHTFQVPETASWKQRRWRYACDCREHQLSTTRHKRVERGQQYRCRICDSLLRRKPD